MTDADTTTRVTVIAYEIKRIDRLAVRAFCGFCAHHVRVINDDVGEILQHLALVHRVDLRPR